MPEDNRPCCFLISGVRELFCLSQFVEDIFRCSCCQNVIAFLRKVGEYFDYLPVGFSGTVYNFRESPAEPTVMVNLGETEVFEWKMPQILNRFIYGNFSGFDLFQKLL